MYNHRPRTYLTSKHCTAELPIGVSLQDLLAFLCHISIWTDWRSILDALKAGRLVLKSDQLRMEALSDLTPRGLRILSWLIWNLNICAGNQELQQQLQHVLSAQTGLSSPPSGRASALQEIRAAHGGCAGRVRRSLETCS